MFNPLKGNLGPDAAIPKALECKGMAFGKDGHLYTTYKIAILAGVNSDIAHILAYFSQYPDIDPGYNAAELWLDKYVPVGNDKKWIEYIFNKLHSLHGGDDSAIKNRKEALANLIQELYSQKEYWKAGIFIHALGDAYAHTKNKLNSDDEVAYGEGLGHGWDSFFGRDPDNIDRVIVREKYIAYIKHLYGLLRTQSANDSEFNDFCSKIDVSFCYSKICPTFQVLSDEDEGKVDNFTNCMNKSMRNLTHKEMDDLLNKI